MSDLTCQTCRPLCTPVRLLRAYWRPLNPDSHSAVFGVASVVGAHRQSRAIRADTPNRYRFSLSVVA
jgi:hypothetical protein